MEGKFYSKKTGYLFTGIIFAVCMALIFIKMGFFPFGNKSMLISDMRSQYVDFFEFYKRALPSLYSFKLGIGGNLFTFFSYYLASPINVLVFLFRNMEHAAAVIFVVKIALCAFACCFYLSNSIFIKNPERHGILIAVMANCYAFCGFSMMYSMSIIWLDSVYLFPLLIWSAERVLAEDGKYLIFISAAAILVNFYTGIMSLCFSAMYLIALYIMFPNKFVRKIPQYAECYFTGISLSCFLLVPSLIGMSTSKMNSENTFGKLIGNFGLTVSSLFHVLLYIWIALLIAAILRRIIRDKLRKTVAGRAFRGVRVAVLALVICVFIADALIYVFSIKNNDFISALKGFKCFLPFMFEGNAPQLYCGAASIAGLILLLILPANKREKAAFAALFAVAVTPIFSNTLDLLLHFGQEPVSFPHRYSFAIIFYCVIFAALGLTEAAERLKNKIPSGLNAYLGIFIAVCFTAELGANAVGFFRYNEKCWFDYDDEERLTLFVNETSAALENIDDGSFFRVEKNFMRNINDSMQLNYNGINHYSSIYNTKLINFLIRCGCLTTVYYPTFTGSTPLLDSLFGVKYLMDSEDENFIGKVSPHSVNGKSYYRDRYFPMSQSVVSLYRNDNAADFAFGADRGALALDITTLNDSSFDNINTVFNSLAGAEISPYKRQEVVEGHENYFEINAAETGGMFISIAPPIEYASVYVNGERVSSGQNDMFGQSYHNIYCGYFSQGDMVTIEIESPEQIPADSVRCYIEEENGYNWAAGVLREPSVTYNFSSESKITMNTGSYEGLLVTEIPYDENWHVTCGGEEIKKENVFGVFLGLDLRPEQNEIVFTYKQDGLAVSIAVSLLAAVYAFIIILKRRNKRR